MFYQAIVKTPSDLSILDIDGDGDYIIGNGIVGELAAMRTEWPEHPCPDGGTMMPGTRVVAGEKLNHVLLDISSNDPLMLLQGIIRAATDANGDPLDWEVVAMDYLYIWDVLAIDDNGEVITLPADLAPTNALEPFLADEVDADGNTVRPTLPKALHTFGSVGLEVPV